MATIQEFGQRVKDTREAIPATLDDIALFSGLSVERLELVEAGKDKSINALEITRLAFALGVDFGYLMRGEVSNA